MSLALAESYNVECDENRPGCERVIFPPAFTTKQEARAFAHRLGWITENGRDICPGCQGTTRKPRGTAPKAQRAAH